MCSLGKGLGRQEQEGCPGRRQMRGYAGSGDWSLEGQAEGDSLRLSVGEARGCQG